MKELLSRETLQGVVDKAPRPGRNEPCYCGSGKKYKKCHMAEDRAAEAEKRRLAEAGRWLRRDFMKFARDQRFAAAFTRALPLYWNGCYTLDNAEEMSQNEAVRFFDWFVFDYQDEEDELPRLIDIYREERYETLSTAQQQVLDQWVNAPPASAYELLGWDGQTLQVRDFVSGETYDVHEPAGHGPVQAGDLLLGRLVPLLGRLEFSTLAAYLPQDEIADLADKLEQARAADRAEHPDADEQAFLRRHGHLIIHHALEQAEQQGRPPVAGHDPNRADELARKAARQLRRLQRD